MISNSDYLDSEDHVMPNQDMKDFFNLLKEKNRGYWDWDEIHYSWTGKDADLEDGHQGLHITGGNDKWITGYAYIGKTVVGTDVCLNIPDDLSDDDYDGIMDIYMEQAESLVCGCDVSGEWDGDSWFMCDSVPFKVRLPFDDDGNLDKEKLLDLMEETASKALESIVESLQYVEKCLEVAAGWRTVNDERCKQGNPSEFSAYQMHLQNKQNNN